jgi:hypothetical protein
MTLRPRLLALALLFAVAACASAICWLGALHRWDWQAAYLQGLAWAFVFWNSVRILTYVPTLRLLLKPGASAAHYSVATWSSWVFSNGTLALYLFEAGGRNVNSLVLLNTGNALMCFITCALIVRLRWRKAEGSQPPKMEPLGDGGSTLSRAHNARPANCASPRLTRARTAVRSPLRPPSFARQCSRARTAS